MLFPPPWRLYHDIHLLRVGGTIDTVAVTDRAVLAITGGSRTAAEDAALDLADFHRWCRGVPVIPVLLRPPGTPLRPQFPLPLAGAAPVVEATADTLPALLRQIGRFPPLGRDPAAWRADDYAPVPGLTDAACLLYAAHDVAAMRLAAAGPETLRRARAAIGAAVAGEGHTIVFVTGAPGAGKTLCGLDIAFAPKQEAAFLTGNPTLVHVLREALSRDAAVRGLDRRAARRRMMSVIQSLPHFRDRYAHAGTPPERLVVIDEAQRCWTRDHAVHATRKREIRLTESEPAHLLDAMARRPGGATVVCLLGGGQEIHDGEGGLAVWGEALARRPSWRVIAPDHAPDDPRQRLPPGLPVTRCADLHLSVPIRPNRAPDTAAWVNAVLADDPARAAALTRHTMGAGLPFRLTRSLDDLRAALRGRGSRTSALVASSGARRLRAEGLGATVPHQDDEAVARWFLDRWPDIRSSDALEVVGTEFAVQGLEFDRVGLCWDADLVRGFAGWEARRFRGSAWTRMAPAAGLNRLNAYRVLLTRARHGTVIWVPRGSGRDGTREPARYDAVAAYLEACGVPHLDADRRTEQDAPAAPEPALL